MIYNIDGSQMASSSQSSLTDIHFGPIDDDILWMQEKHICQHIWNGHTKCKLSMRGALPKNDKEDQIPPQIIAVEASFYHVAYLGFMHINAGLIIPFVER